MLLSCSVYHAAGEIEVLQGPRLHGVPLRRCRGELVALNAMQADLAEGDAAQQW